MGNAILVRRSGVDVSDGTALQNQVLADSSFYAGENSDIQTGTMPNRGAVNQVLNAGGVYTIPEGYHNGMGKVSAASLEGQTQGTATPTQILSGQTAYVNGQKITGTMPNRGANNIVLPVNGNVAIPEGYHNGQGKVTQSLVTQGAYTNPISSVGTNPAYIRIPQGYYGTNTGSGYPEVVYSLDMARSSGYALQSEVEHWRNSYYGMEQDRNNWINVANSRPNVVKHEYSALLTRADYGGKRFYLNEAFFQYGIVAVIRIKKLVMYYTDKLYNVLATPHMIYLFGLCGVGSKNYYERNYSIGGTGNIEVSSSHWSEIVTFPGTSRDHFGFFTRIYTSDYEYKNACVTMSIGENYLAFVIDPDMHCYECEVEFEVTHYHVQ